MMHRKVILILAVAALAGTARAILPPDASAREPQIRAYRQQVRNNYEKRLVERQELAVRAYEQTRADIFTPPWVRAGMHAALLTGVDGSLLAEMERTEKRNNRLFASIVLLILIAGAAGWVRYATKEIEEDDG